MKKTNAKYKFSRAAIICGCLASTFYALGGVMTWWRYSIPKPLLILVGIFSCVGPAMCLIAPGVILRPISIQRYLAWGFYGIVGSFFLLVARAWCMVNYGGSPPPPWPDFSIFGLPTLFAIVACLPCGIFLADIRKKWWIKLLSPLIAGGIVLLMSWLFKITFQWHGDAYIQGWEFATILFAGPCLCFFTWLPFDLIKNIEMHNKGNYRD